MNKLCTAHLILSLLFLILKPYVCRLDRRVLWQNYLSNTDTLQQIVSEINGWAIGRRDFFAGAKLSHADLESGASHIG